jgi:hypothetical protein
MILKNQKRESFVDEGSCLLPPLLQGDTTKKRQCSDRSDGSNGNLVAHCYSDY